MTRMHAWTKPVHACDEPTGAMTSLAHHQVARARMQADGVHGAQAQALWAYGQRHAGAQRWEQAAAAFWQLVREAPGFVPGWLELSRACERLDRYRQALSAARNAAAACTGAHPLLALSVVLRLRQFEENALALDCVRIANLVATVPEDRRAALAMAISNAGDNRLAMHCIERASAAQPPGPALHHMQGLLHLFDGDMPAAAGSFTSAIRVDPAYAPAYLLLAQLPGAAGDDARTHKLQSLCDSGALAPQHRVLAAYALHLELHAQQRFDEAWQALAHGHRLASLLRPYDSERAMRLLSEIRASPLPAESHAGRLDAIPIFIVGMYRSGSTLLERMLGGHPDVTPLGETGLVQSAAMHATDHFCRDAPDLALIRGLASDAGSLRQALASRIAASTGGKRVVTEKQNANFLLLGQIARALPEARFLHIVRDPVDTCFSNLRTHFARGAGYVSDPLHLADYYAMYVSLMRHWQGLLPDRILEVGCDELVRNPLSSLQRISGFCGLDYHPAMADVARPGGSIATASAGLARTGIVAGRSGAWQPYAKHLAPLLERLREHHIIH